MHVHIHVHALSLRSILYLISSDLSCIVHVLYTRKFSWDSIFTDGRSLLFGRFNFHGYLHSRPLCAVQSSLFHWFNFSGYGNDLQKMQKLGPSKISHYMVFDICVYIVILYIIGPLSAVTLFRRISSSNPFVYSWTPPPTLDLTDVSPDVVYSIEVYNITCGANDLLGTLNNLTVSLYQNALLDPGHVYKVVIVPRSNVRGARNGTTFTKYGKI